MPLIITLLRGIVGGLVSDLGKLVVEDHPGCTYRPAAFRTFTGEGRLDQSRLVPI